MKIKYAKALRSIAKIVLLLCFLSLLGLGIFFTYKSLKYKPYKVRVSNVTDSAFTVSWVTDEPMVGVVYYAEKDSFLPGPLSWIGKSKAVDDRDVSNAQTECVSEFNKKASKTKDDNFTVDIEGYDCNNVKVVKKGRYYTHHVTVQNLDAEKEYYFRVGDGYISYAEGKTDGVEYIEREMPAVEVFSQKTFPVIDEVSSPNPAYGTSYNLFYSKDGQVGMKKNFDAIIFLKTFKEGVEYPLMSAVSNNDGGWSIDYANVRDFEGKTLGMENTYVEFIPQVENAKPGASGTSKFEDTEYPLNLMGNNMDDLEEQKSVSAESVSYIKNMFVRDVEAKLGDSCYCVSKNCSYINEKACTGACIQDKLTCQGQLEDKPPAVVEILCYKCNGTSLETKYFDKNKGCEVGYSVGKPNCSTPTSNQITCWNSEGKSKKVDDSKCSGDYPYTDLPKNCCTYSSSTNSCGTCNKPCTGTNLTESVCEKKVEDSDKGTKTCCKVSIGNDSKPACDCKTLQESCSGEYKEYTNRAACISTHVVTTGQCKPNGCRDYYLTVRGGNVAVVASKPSIFSRLLGFRSYAALSESLKVISGEICNGDCNGSGNEDIRDDDSCANNKKDCVQWFSKKDCSYVFRKKSATSLDGYTKNQSECGVEIIDGWKTCITGNSTQGVDEAYNTCKDKLGDGGTSEANIKKIITNCVQTGATAKIVSGGCESPCYIQYTLNGHTCGTIALPSGSAFCSNPYCPQQDRKTLEDYAENEATKECPLELRGGCLCPKNSVKNFVKNGETCEKKKEKGILDSNDCSTFCDGEKYSSCTCDRSCEKGSQTVNPGEDCGGKNQENSGDNTNSPVSMNGTENDSCPSGKELCYQATGNNGLTCEGECVEEGTCTVENSSKYPNLCEAKNKMIYTCYQEGASTSSSTSTTCNPLPDKWRECDPENGIHYTKNACENVEKEQYYYFSNVYNNCTKSSQSQCSSGADTNCYYQDPTCGGRAGCYTIEANSCKQASTSCPYETLSDCEEERILKEQSNDEKVCCKYSSSYQVSQSSHVTTYTYYEMKSPGACALEGKIVEERQGEECTSIAFQEIENYPLGSNLTGSNKFSCCSSAEGLLTLVSGNSCPEDSTSIAFSFCEALKRRFIYCLDKENTQVFSYSYLGDKEEEPSCPEGQVKVERSDWKTDDGEYCCVDRKIQKGCSLITETRQSFSECATYEGDFSSTGQTSLPKIQENTKASLISKTYAQTEDSLPIIYFPETGAYEIEESGEKRYVVGEKDQSQIVYIERNGIPGFQSPKDLATPKEDEDLFVDASAFVTSVTQLTSGKIIELKEGVNIISLNLFPTDGTESNQLTSKQFLELVNGTGRNVSRISYFGAGQWKGGTSFDFSTFETKGEEFMLTPGKGYVVVAEKDVRIVVPGYTSESPIPIAFSSGWNLVGVHGYDTQYTANSLINSINTIEGLKSNNVTYWPTSKGMYQGYQLSEGQEYGQDFPISKDLGYFVRISEFNASDDSCKSIIWNPGGDLNGKCGSSN